MTSFFSNSPLFKTTLLAFAFLSACASAPANLNSSRGHLSPTPAAPAPPEVLSSPATNTVNEAEWELLAAGDILLGGSATPELRQRGYTSPFSRFTQWVAGADIAYANFEAPAGTRGQAVAQKTYTFRMAPAAVSAVKTAGFDVLHLANNHILDYGEEALDDTLKLLDRHRLRGCGAGKTLQDARKPAIFTTANGLNVAFLCYSNTFPKSYWATETRAGTAFGHERWVREDIARVATDATVDLVVAAFHWGAELMEAPKPYQTKLAEAAFAAGASVVLGHHPHVLQPIDVVAGRIAAYSLGNFVFGSYSRRVSTSALVRIRGAGRVVTEVSVLPLDVFNPRVVFHPRVLTGPAGKSVSEFLLGPKAELTDQGWWRLRIPPPDPITQPSSLEAILERTE